MVLHVGGHLEVVALLVAEIVDSAAVDSRAWRSGWKTLLLDNLLLTGRDCRELLFLVLLCACGRISALVFVDVARVGIGRLPEQMGVVGPGANDLHIGRSLYVSGRSRLDDEVL